MSAERNSAWSDAQRNSQSDQKWPRVGRPPVVSSAGGTKYARAYT
jgi:hypothetical protein